MTALLKTPEVMTVDEFLAWEPGDGRRWQLVDGLPRAMAPANRTHGILLINLGARLWAHINDRGLPCTVMAEPGVRPHVQGATNIRIPDLGVDCTRSATEEQALVEHPVVLVEILSPSNQAETWSNVWTYTTIPSVREILVLRSVVIGAELLRRLPDGTWPERSEPVGPKDDLVFDSLQFRTPLAALYAGTWLAIT